MILMICVKKIKKKLLGYSKSMREITGRDFMII